MYRPTVRYHDIFKEYVNDLFHSSRLDRNQIIRLALFAAPYSSFFQQELKHTQKKGVSVVAGWRLTDKGLWVNNEEPRKQGVKLVL
jgi:hypothetical protein